MVFNYFFVDVNTHFLSCRKLLILHPQHFQLVFFMLFTFIVFARGLTG